MATRFEQFAIGRAVAKMLNIKGEENFPTRLNTDELQPVLCIPGPRPPDTEAFMDLTNQSLTGLTSWGWGFWGDAAQWISTGYPGGAAAPQKLSNFAEKEHWVRSIRLVLAISAADAIALDGKRCLITVYCRTQVGFPPDIGYMIQHFFMIRAGQTFYPWVFPQSNSHLFVADSSPGMGQWDGYVPPGYFSALHFESYDGGVFGADATLSGQIWVSESAILTGGH